MGLALGALFFKNLKMLKNVGSMYVLVVHLENDSASIQNKLKVSTL